MKKPTPVESTAPGAPILRVHSLSVRAGARRVLDGLSLDIFPGEILALTGPSGAGKSTFLKCLNRLLDLTPGLAVTGDILFHGRSIFAPDCDVDALRTRIGIVFQQPAVFPTTLRKNVLFGVRHAGQVPRRAWDGLVEECLRSVSLWSEVKERLDESALTLSVGQQQRLCLARTLAMDPEVILLDEPTSALDPKSTEAVEESLLGLKGRRTLVVVTHNMAQASRLADRQLALEPCL